MTIKKAAFAAGLVGILLFSFLLAPAWAADLETTRAQATPGFWKVDGKNNSMWLLGSVHVLTESHYPLAQEVEEAFKNSPHLVVETDVESMEPEAMQQIMFNAGMLTDGRSLRDVLGRQRYERASELAAANGYHLESLNMLRPWVVALVFSAAEFEKMGYSPEHGVDSYFLNRAGDGHKTVVELESFADQVKLFEVLEEELQVALMMQTLEEMQDMEEQISALMGAWEAGDTDMLEQVLLESFADYPLLYEQLVTDRNHQWLTDLADMLTRDEDYFVVVGALHLVGENSVVNLLRNEGYTVTRQ